MFRFLLSGLLVLACAADALAQTTPPAPATTTRHTTQHTTRRTTSMPRRTTVRKTTTKKVGVLAPTARPAAVVQRQTAAADPASGKGQGVYAAPGEPVNIKSGATMGYDGPAARRAKTKTATTLTPTPR
jgi:hypothetical protein